MKKIIISFSVLIIILIIGSSILTYQKLPNLSNYRGSKDGTTSTDSGRAISDVQATANILKHNAREGATLVIQTEDRRFYSHIGIDLYGIVRAGYYNLIHGQVVQGGSTITQQLLKHHRGHSTRTRSHKIQEARGAIILTVLYSKLGPAGNPGKRGIINYYLDHVPFPNGGVVGYATACEYYFDKQCDQLFESEILFLIAVAQDGSNPYRQTNFDRIKKLSMQLCHKRARANTREDIDLDCSQMDQLSPSQIHDLSRHDDTLDPRTRLVLEDYPSMIFDTVLTDQIGSLIQTNRALLEQHQAHDCCIVVVGPKGEIVSYNQCRDYDERVGTVDLCRTRRQTGSAIKPFVYAQAFAQFGYTGGTMIEDEPVSFDLGDGSLYQPKNFDNQFHGSVTLAQALGNSFNIPAIKLTHQLGVAQVISLINQLRYEYGQNLIGLESERSIFTSSQLGLSVGLGTYEISPLEFARIRGYRYAPSPIGGGLGGGFQREEQQIKQQIISILSDPLNRIISFGQDNLLNRSGRFVKTGTSRKFIDGRTCGGKIDRELIVCVRVGNHDISSMDSSSMDTAGYLRYLTTQLIDKSYSKSTKYGQ